MIYYNISYNDSPKNPFKCQLGICEWTNWKVFYHDPTNEASSSYSIFQSPKIQNILKLPDIIREITQQLQSYHPQTTQSFFSYKKSQVSTYSSSDQRRSSLGPLVISKIQDLGRIDKDNSPPRLGSPVCQSTSVVDPISEYGMHANDIWQLRSDVNCTNNSKTPKYGLYHFRCIFSMNYFGIWDTLIDQER